MDYIDKIKQRVLIYKNLGYKMVVDGNELIAYEPKIGERAWLFILYSSLNKTEIDYLQEKIPYRFPQVFIDFLFHLNGIGIINSTLSIMGYQKKIDRKDPNNRQPYSIIKQNTVERINNSKENYFFVGGYSEDGSLLYIDTKTNLVHRCSRIDCTPVFTWNSFEEMVVSEVFRICDKIGLDILETDITPGGSLEWMEE